MSVNTIDELKYSIAGEDYQINPWITVHNPCLYEIKAFGEDAYYTLLHLFTRKPYDIAVELFDNGIDYQSIRDWDLFYQTAPHIPVELSHILFGNLDFTEFVANISSENGLKVLTHKFNKDLKIDEAIYQKIATYLRYMHFISEKVEYDVGNSMAKKFLIDRMRRKQKKALMDFQSGKTKKQSQLASMIKYCVNNSNFKYDYSSVMNLKLNLLYESYYFIIHNNERENLISGIYHGTIDVKKMKNKSILDINSDLHK
ncbi:MAG: hypothetical protein HFG54_14945 [Lachnospiraceae bacterium]|nr:hypothetical protein [Lachnospiraceae bacterium]